jgi:hypothetical protein
LSGDDYQIAGVLSAESGDTRVAHGAQLVRFVEAVLANDVDDLATARDAVRDAVGPAAFVDVCATVASFSAVVKLADGSGIPLEAEKAERTADLRAEFGLDGLWKG